MLLAIASGNSYVFAVAVRPNWPPLFVLTCDRISLIATEFEVPSMTSRTPFQFKRPNRPRVMRTVLTFWAVSPA